MPIGFLTAAERDRLNRFPALIPDEDLRAFFLLSEADQQAINRQREAHTRLGFALQLCALRYLGFAPDDLSTAPAEVVGYVAHQLAVPPEGHPGLWAADQNADDPSPAGPGVSGLSPRDPAWISMRCKRGWGSARFEHDKPTLLLQLACDKLRREQIVRPGVTRLERLVATARQQAQTETFRRLTPSVDGRTHHPAR